MKKNVKNIFSFFTSSRLRSKALLLFIVLSTFPALFLGATALYSINLSHESDVSQLELQLINLKIEEIKKFFADTLGILEIRITRDIPEISKEDQEVLLEGLFDEVPAFIEASFINLSGVETTKKASDGKDLVLMDVSRLEKFQKPSQGISYIGDVYHTLYGPFITLASPITNKNNEIIQILSAEVNLKQIVRSINTTPLGASGYLVLFSKNGTLMSEHFNVRPGVDYSNAHRVQRVLNGFFFDGLATEDSYISFLSGIPVVGAGRIIPEFGWALFAEWPISDADRVTSEVRNQIVMYTLFVLAAVIIIAVLFSSRMVRPIRVLEKRARAIEHGDFSKKKIIKTDDELEELSIAFNKMSQGLKRLHELKDEFVFVATHELRTPVTAIRGYISMAQEILPKDSSEDMKDFLNQAYLANDRLHRLVNDLLEVARSDAGRIEITCVPIDIVTPIRETLEEIKPLADEKGIGIEYNPNNAPFVLGDVGRIKEVMVNLIGNAIKYSPEKANIWIGHEKKNKTLVTYVKDNGFGMTQEEQQKLFQKFYRVKNEKTNAITGTGLGLFIVKQIVERMKGKIWVESEKDEGSIFHFSLLITDSIPEKNALPAEGGIVKKADSVNFK